MQTTDLKTKVEIKELYAKHADQLEWESTRFPENEVKTLSFHDGVAFFITKTAPGGYTFPHLHEFRQFRYILEGEYIVNGKTYGPGTLIEFPDLVPYEVSCPKGATWIVVQVPGKNGKGPTDPRGLNYGEPPPRTEADSPTK